MHPGLGNSGEGHWQSIWEKMFPNFIRVQQHDWETPKCEEWITSLDEEVVKHDAGELIIVGHSLACATIAFWASVYNRKIKGALLVAPSDTEGENYPPGTSGFSPMPLNKLPFQSITISSRNDFYVALHRAKLFANAWGSRFVDVGEAGHINVASGYGEWDDGLKWLKVLDQT
jgi:predicted alpha/beta hydrolase family esterase